MHVHVCYLVLVCESSACNCFGVHSWGHMTSVTSSKDGNIPVELNISTKNSSSAAAMKETHAAYQFLGDCL